MRKALIVTTVGGFVSQFEMNDVHILQELGYEVHYASDFNNQIYEVDKKCLQDNGIILHQVDIRKSPLHIFKNYKAIRKVRELIQQEEIALVHCHTPMGAVVARLAAPKKNAPYVIYTAHGFHFYKGAPLINWLLYYPMEKLLAHRTDHIVTINQEDFERACKMRLRRQGKVSKISGVGVDMDRFTPKKELRDVVRKELGIPQDFFHIMTVAELNSNKNQQVIIEAMSRLDNSDIYYSIVGNGPYRDRLQKLIEKKGLSDRVKLLGYRKDTDRILQSADCFAFPSKREGLGIAAIEALACGVPVIALDNRGTREYITQDNGIMCSSNSVNEFRIAIEQMQEVTTREKLMANSRCSVARFGIKHVDKEMRGIYK